MDCPVDASIVTMELDLPGRSESAGYSRKDFNLPDNACVLFSGGRPQKFQNAEYWRVILSLLSERPDLYYLAVGVAEDNVPFLSQMMPAEVRNRIQFLGWRTDYLRILGMADIVLDTYPSGGGVVMVDAMAMGIPIISFENDYMKQFDQTEASGAEENIPVPELIIPRGAFDKMKELLSKLIEDKGYRLSVSKRCKEHIFKTRGNPKRMVERCEAIYVKVLENSMDNYYYNKRMIEVEARLAELEQRLSVVRKQEKELQEREQELQEREHEHQALQQTRAVVIASKLAEHPLLMKVVETGYKFMAKIYHWFGGR
jgi:glycosyltransferase involved in cell wall biosynthesis